MSLFDAAIAGSMVEGGGHPAQQGITFIDVQYHKDEQGYLVYENNSGLVSDDIIESLTANPNQLFVMKIHPETQGDPYKMQYAFLGMVDYYAAVFYAGHSQIPLYGDGNSVKIFKIDSNGDIEVIDALLHSN